MVIRHCVEKLNVEEGSFIIDPKKIRHGVIVGGRVESMSGPVDPASHLNLDYPDHAVTNCVVVEKFEKGAKARIENTGLVLAKVKESGFQHYGKVDYTQRLSEMIEAIRRIHATERPQTTDKGED